MLYTIATVIGWISTIQSLFIFVAKKRETILILKLINDVLNIINFTLLGTYTGALLNLIAVLRESVFYFKDKKKWANSKFWLILFLLLMMISPLSVVLDPTRSAAEKWVQILPAMGSSLAVIGLYMSKEQVLRILNLFAVTPWVIYNLFNNNIPALVNSCLGIVSVAWGLIMYFILDKKEKNKMQQASLNSGENVSVTSTENLTESEKTA
jgi:hypothetical protein